MSSHIELFTEIEITLNKHGDIFKCICNKENLAGTSRISYEEAEKDLLKQIENRIWDRNYDLKIKIKN